MAACRDDKLFRAEALKLPTKAKGWNWSWLDEAAGEATEVGTAGKEEREAVKRFLL